MDRSCLPSHPCILDPLREQFLALLPVRHVSHPLGCHRPRIDDAVVFDKLVKALVFSAGYERIAEAGCSATTLRRRRDEWIAAGVFDALRRSVLAAYERLIGLDLTDVSVDGCITKAPGGGKCAARSPVDRGKGGLKRSQLADVAGVPITALPAPANTRDHVLLPATLDVLTDLLTEVGVAPERTTVHFAAPRGGPAAEQRPVVAVDSKTLRWTRRPDGRVHEADLRLRPRSAASAHPGRGGRRRRNRRLHRRAEHPGRNAGDRRCAALPARARQLAARTRGALPVHGQGQPARPAPGPGRAALGSGPGTAPARTAQGVESRSIKVIDLDGHPAQALFSSAAREIKVVRARRRQADGHRSIEIIYAVTSLNHRRADPTLLAGWIRRQWAIANAVHHVRDMTQGEDASWIRTGSEPQVMAALPNTALNLARLNGQINVARAQRHTSWQPGVAQRAPHVA